MCLEENWSYGEHYSEMILSYEFVKIEINKYETGNNFDSLW